MAKQIVIPKQLQWDLRLYRLHACPTCGMIYDCKEKNCCNGVVFVCPLHYNMDKECREMTVKEYNKLLKRTEFLEPVFLALERIKNGY
jgi:hypothetical protein